MHKQKKNLFLISLLLILTSPKTIYANFDSNQRAIERTQRLLELKRENEYINQELKYPMRKEIVIKKKPLDNIKEGEKYFFSQIKIEGGKKYQKALDKIIEKHIATKMSKEDIFKLVGELSNYYIENGYITTIVTVKKGNVKLGLLVFEVKEGKLNEIKIKNEKELTLKKKLKLFTAFPNRKDELLNIHDIDQGIENMNIGGWNNVMEVIPIEEYGYSDIIIEENYSWSGISIGVDNSSYKDNGREKLNISLEKDNLLGINDKLSFNFIERLTYHRKQNKETNYDLNYFFPLGYLKFSYNFNFGDSYNTIDGDFGSYRTDGKSYKHKFRISRVVERTQNSKSTLYFDLTLKDNKNKMEGLLLEVNSKKYSYFSIGGNHVNKLWGGSFFSSINYERGVEWFGGEGNSDNPDSPKPEFNKFNINLDWQRQIYLKNNSYFEYNFSLGGSYSPDRLLSANKFNMGDEFTVRGFKESSVSGDKGIYINNTLSYNLSREKYKILSKFKPFIGLDFGVSKDVDLENSDKIAGIAAGLSFYSNGLYGILTFSAPLRRSEGMPKETQPIYFSVSYRY